MPETADLSGIVVPLLTPTDAEDRVDEPALRRLDRPADRAGVHGLFVGGSAGEGPLLDRPRVGPARRDRLRRDRAGGSRCWPARRTRRRAGSSTRSGGSRSSATGTSS